MYQTGIPEHDFDIKKKTGKMKKNKPRILIADDNQMNRSMLKDILGDEFEIMEASNGAYVCNIMKSKRAKIDLLLLDMMIPGMDGFEVLEKMMGTGVAGKLPVIMISSESSPSYLKRAYDLGITDYISRPFDVTVVRNRVNNAIMLHANKYRMDEIISGRMYERRNNSKQVINMLSHLIEYRNMEEDVHIRRVNVVTRLLLECLYKKEPQYELTRENILMITEASSLHDIGKICVPDRILKKKGALTNREYEIVKYHTLNGASLAQKFLQQENQKLAAVVYEVCRWHHERYDGKGYPDGLEGDCIPIAAQVVSLADAYGALTSKRAYGEKYSYKKALQMILNGDCGRFNPILLEYLKEIANRIPREVSHRAAHHVNRYDLDSILFHLRDVEPEASDRTLQLMEIERTKYQFFASMSKEIQFEYISSSSMVTISDWGAERLGINATIMDPCRNWELIRVLGEDTLREIRERVEMATPDQPVFQYEGKINIDGELRWHRIICRKIWLPDDHHSIRVIGKLLDIHDEHVQMVELKRMAYYDALTGLLNHANARMKIQSRLCSKAEGKFALAIVDLDYFKEANDNFGHAFGDRVLQLVAGRLRGAIRSDDIAARVGGDEFMIFLEYKAGLEHIVQRILSELSGEFQGFSISVSMGIAMTDVVGKDYDTLFQCADQALYSVKRSKRGTYRFYDDSLKDMLSVISPIDAEQE